MPKVLDWHRYKPPLLPLSTSASHLCYSHPPPLLISLALKPDREQEKRREVEEERSGQGNNIAHPLLYTSSPALFPFSISNPGNGRGGQTSKHNDSHGYCVAPDKWAPVRRKLPGAIIHCWFRGGREHSQILESGVKPKLPWSTRLALWMLEAEWVVYFFLTSSCRGPN